MCKILWNGHRKNDKGNIIMEKINITYFCIFRAPFHELSPSFWPTWAFPLTAGSPAPIPDTFHISSSFPPSPSLNPQSPHFSSWLEHYFFCLFLQTAWAPLDFPELTPPESKFFYFFLLMHYCNFLYSFGILPIFTNDFLQI